MWTCEEWLLTWFSYPMKELTTFVGERTRVREIGRHDPSAIQSLWSSAHAFSVLPCVFHLGLQVITWAIVFLFFMSSSLWTRLRYFLMIPFTVFPLKSFFKVPFLHIWKLLAANNVIYLSKNPIGPNAKNKSKSIKCDIQFCFKFSAILQNWCIFYN